MNPPDMFANSRAASMIEAATARAKTAGQTGSTLEAKHTAMMIFITLMTIEFKGNVPPGLRYAFGTVCRILAPELGAPEHDKDRDAIAGAFMSDLADLRNKGAI